MKILILGGTSDARKIAEELLAQPVDIIYSIAGLVSKPNLACAVISGGFRQYQERSTQPGFENYVLRHGIDAVLDATHPYALKMTEQAQLSCERLGMKYWRFDRPAWQVHAQDTWLIVSQWSQLITACAAFDKPLLTTGQISQQSLDLIADNSRQVVYRTAASAHAKLAENVQWLKARGPFDYATELALFEQFQPDVLVSKNAGGDSTYAKLLVARALKIPVIMLDRPQGDSKAPDQKIKDKLLAASFSNRPALVQAIVHWSQKTKTREA